MVRLTAVMGVVGAVTALLLVLVLVPDSTAPLLGTVIAVAGGIALLLEKTMPARLTGALAIVLGLLGGFMVLGSVGGKGGSVSLGTPEMGSAVLAIACLLLPVGAAWSGWALVRPVALGALGLAAAAAVAVLALARSDSLVQQSDAVTLVTGALCLLAILPLIGLFAGPSPAQPAARGEPAQRP